MPRTSEVIMIYTVLFVFLCFAITGVPAPGPGGHTKICHHCHLVQNPSHCHAFKTCDREEVCFTEVHHQNGEYLYTLGCKGHHECEHHVVPVGKRAHLLHERSVVCKECCDTNNCNGHLCAGYHHTVTKAPATHAPTHAPHTHATTHAAPLTTQAIVTTAHPLPTTPAPLPTTPAPLPTTPVQLPTTQEPLPIDSMTTTWSPQGASIAVTEAPLVTTTSECADYEDPTFSCADWASHGFCSKTSGQGYEISKLRCREFCGFCS